MVSITSRFPLCGSSAVLVLGTLLVAQMSPASCGSILVGRDDLPPLEWWQQTIVYQIYPRSFQDSDGDGIGDLKGIQSRLDYLADLGVGAVWLSPIYKSPMKDFGYDISDFTDVDPMFGTLQDFEELATQMQLRGIRVIMDFIPNHSSDQHEWFVKSVAREEPYTDFYTWKDARIVEGNRLPPNNWVSVFGGSMWEWSEQRQQYYLHQFAKEQPDLRLENPAVTQKMLEAMEFWMDLGVDGFRMDAVPHMFENQTFPDEPPSDSAEPGTPEDEYSYWEHPHTFNLPDVLVSLREYRKVLDAKSAADGKSRVMMTEGYVEPLSELMKYYGTPAEPIAHFPFNFELIGSLPTFQAATLKQVIDGWMTAMPTGSWANWLVGNHDNSRAADRLGAELVDAINMVVLLLPGTAVTYYGEELGMRNRKMTWEETKDPAGCNAGQDRYELYSRDPERTPMQWDATKNAGFSTGDDPWLPLHENYVTLNVDAQSKAIESHLKVYKALAALRQTPEWRYGGLETRTFGEVFAFSRRNATHGFLVLANLGTTQATFYPKSSFTSLPSASTVYARSVGFKGAETVGSSVSLDEFFVLEAKNSVVLRYPADDTGSSSGNRRLMMWSTIAACLLAAVGIRLLSHN